MSPIEATTSTSPRPHFPEIHEEGDIPIRLLDTTNGHLPSFFYAPLDGSGKKMRYRAEMEAQQIESMSELFEDYGSAAAHFVRDNSAHVNYLYNGGPHIYRYQNTSEPWDYSYNAIESGKVERCWTLKSTKLQQHEAQHQTLAQSSMEPATYDTPGMGLRRVVVQEGFEYEAIANNFWRISSDLYDIEFDQNFLPDKSLHFSHQSELQLCWYSIKSHRHSKKLSRHWPSGPLYGSEPGTAKLVGKAFSITTTSPKKEGSSDEWTCFIRTPSRFFEGEDFAKLLHEPLLRMPLSLELFTSIALRVVLKDLSELLTYMESLVAVHTTIVNPEEHDRLLFDDEQFSRSRLYFRMLSSLATFIHMMEETKLICERLEIKGQELYLATVRLSDQEAKALGAVKPHTNSLGQAMERAATLQQRVMALRDGLFNASAVLESRAANRLSENVKLLTYVSIFCLPLAFCTSLWSTTDTFSWNGLKVAMVLTGVIIYLVIFNLNQLVRLSRSIYDVGKKTVVKSMTESDNDDWKQRAARFGQFRPPRSEPQPSEWLLLWYLSVAIFASIWTAVSKLCRAIFSSSDTASSVPHESLAPSCSGPGPQEVKEESTTEDATAEALHVEDDAKPGNMTEDAKHSAIDHQTSDADPTPKIQATSGASEQDENVGSIHTPTASGNLAPTPAVGFMSQPSNTSLPIPRLLRRHSRKAPDLEAGVKATDECERD